MIYQLTERAHVQWSISIVCETWMPLVMKPPPPPILKREGSKSMWIFLKCNQINMRTVIYIRLSPSK